FALVGAALALRTGAEVASRPPTGEAFRGLALTVSAGSLLGYAYGVHQYGLTPFSAMPLHSAMGLTLLSAGVLASVPRGVLAALIYASPAGGLARHLLPAMVMLSVALGWFVLVGARAVLYTPEIAVALALARFVTAAEGHFVGNTVELVARRHDGAEFPVELSLGAWRSGADTRLTGIIRDITERKHSEEVRSFLAAIVDSSHDAIVGKSLEGTITSWNKGAERLAVEMVNAQAEALFGYAGEELVGKPVDQLVPERIRGEHVRHRTAYQREPKLRPMGAGLELHGRRKDGTEFPIEISLSPVETENGKIVTAAIRDITERKRTEEELVRARESALSASRAKGEFLANMSHEIRSPMTAILGYADILAESDLSVEERAAYLDTIRLNGAHLLSVINDILTLSKIEAGKMTMERIACSPARLVGEVVALMHHRARDKGIAFEIIYEGLIPERIESDPTRVRQILLNLLSNALKFTERGGVRLTIRMEGGRLAFAVADTGIGMNAEEQARLFQPFTQTDVLTTVSFGG